MVQLLLLGGCFGDSVTAADGDGDGSTDGGELETSSSAPGDDDDDGGSTSNGAADDTGDDDDDESTGDDDDDDGNDESTGDDDDDDDDDGTSTGDPPAECGNGVVEGDEACDDGAANSDTEADACRSDCQLPTCGDDVTDSDEDCDVFGPGCLADCSFDAPDFGPFPAASVVIGQPDAVSGSEFGLGFGFRFPAGVVTHDGAVFVGEGMGVGVFVYDEVPTEPGVLPDDILGRDGIEGEPFDLGPNSLSSFTRGLSTDGTRFAVTDGGGPRVLLFDSVPDTATDADVVIGQPDFVTTGSGISQSQFAGIRDVFIGGDRMVVADTDAHRVLLWNSIPEDNGALPDVVLGQATFDAGEPNRGGEAAADTMRDPTGVWTDGTRLAVADFLNHRVLLWNTFPTENGQPADVVVGQVDGTGSSTGEGATGFNRPFDVIFTGDRLYVSDQFHHRVLYFDGWPRDDGPAADGVIGQSDFANVTPNDLDQDGTNDGQASAQTLSRPTMLHFDDGQLFVVDAFNHRIAVFEGQ